MSEAPPDAGQAEQAQLLAERAELAAGTRIRTLGTVAELRAAEELLRAVWDVDETGPSPLGVAVLRALEHAGNYVAGAFAGDRDDLIGVCAGFFGDPRSRALHSHVAGIATGAHGRGVGYALKLHQRAWALSRGVEVITWTFDPLVARNAYFNIVKLGAAPTEYLVDFYGPMEDGRNAGAPSDRLLVEWDLRLPVVPPVPEPAAACAAATTILQAGQDGAPLPAAPPAAGVALACIPAEVELMRRDEPEVAARWRHALRDAVVPLLATGRWRITAFDRGGCYRLEPTDPGEMGR